jgi:NADH-quinone oxidoreductase subunit G
MLEIKVTDTVTINVDGELAQVPKGVNVIEAMRVVGKEKEIPHYCYHPKLSVVGNCRMCLVEVGNPMKDRQTGEAILEENGEPKIGWAPKPVIGCATNVSEGMHVRTNTPNLIDCRNGVTEFLLINHPLDCPICDQAGECRLQEFSAEHGRGYSRFKEEKNVKPKRTRLGPRVTLDDERCILCSRCVRFSQEVAKDDVLGFVDRGSYSTLTCYPGKELSNNYSLNTVDICPVGALTSTDFRFKMRVWFLKRTHSICTESSVGANTEIWSREGKIYRITPRRNDAVNDTWMTDSGRGLFKEFESEDRLTSYSVDQVAKSLDDAIAATRALLEAGSVGVIGSAHSSVEEQYLLQKIVKQTGAICEMVQHTGEGDGLLLSEDRTPNLRGALINGLINKLPEKELGQLKASIEEGSIKTLLVFNEDLEQLGIDLGNLKESVQVIYFGSSKNTTSERAKVVFPSLSVFEKEGTFVNQNFILQKFKQAIIPPIGLISDCGVLKSILNELNNEASENTTLSMDELWSEISENVEILKSVKWSAIPEEGLALEDAPFADMNFFETVNLKYKPKVVSETM